MRPFASARRLFIPGILGAILFVAEPARAFEGQWHLGGGLGVAAPNGGYDPGAALGVHGAYGLSDVFDLRLELQGSLNDYFGVPVTFYGGRFGLAYKVNVIEWIPYAGISAGSFAVAWNEGWFARPSFGAFGGLDYAVSRHFGLGVFVAGDYIVTYGTITSVLLRGEYRFGW